MECENKTNTTNVKYERVPSNRNVFKNSIKKSSKQKMLDNPNHIGYHNGTYMSDNSVPLYNRLHLNGNNTFIDMKLNQMINKTNKLVGCVDEDVEADECDDFEDYRFQNKISNGKSHGLHGFYNIDGAKYTIHGVDASPVIIQHHHGSHGDLSELARKQHSRVDNCSPDAMSAMASPILKPNNHTKLPPTDNWTRNPIQSQQSPLKQTQKDKIGTAINNNLGVSSNALGNTSQKMSLDATNIYTNQILLIIQDRSGQEWNQLWKHPDFLKHFKNMLESNVLVEMGEDKKFDVEELSVYNESIAYEEDIILIEMMGLCLQNLETEMQHESILEQEKQRSKLEIERLLRTSLEEENNRTNRVKQLAHRTLNSRTCISERQTALDITIANKEKTAALKHQAAIDRFRETQSNWIRNSGIDESIRQHQMKKDAIIREKNEQIFEKFYAKEQRTADILKMQERLMLDSAECVKNNSMEITEANSKHLRIARSEDGQFRAKTAQSIDQKLSRSERHLEKIKDESIRKSEENLEKRILAQFKCEQKRKLQEMERIQKASVLKIQLEKLDVYKEVQASIEYQRPNALRQVFHDTFHQEKMQHRDIRPSPGPGEYDIEYKRKTIGGYMAAKLNSSLNGNKDKISNPPPGCYDPDMSIEQTQVLAKLKARKGCLPFRGRGKADVDWMIAEAARLPGPGQYEFGSKKIPGGKFSKANTKSGIEKEIQSKSGIPGPGAYNDPTIKQITIPLAKIAKKQQIDESIHEDYEELFQSFN